MQIHKHIDFQTPGWGEFLLGPTQGLNALLTQSGGASFPDRPIHGGVGLNVSMTVGDEGAYLAHDLGAEQSVLHLRLMLNPADSSGGSVTLLAGLDGADVESLRVSLDASGDTISVWFAGGTTLSAGLDRGIAWHCVEVAVDTVADEAELWINGVSSDQANADLSASTIQSLRLGAVHKDTATTGGLYLDDIIFADDYIGPVIVEPSESHAGDPTRWLVVYNTADADSGVWAESYRQTRNIPYANLVGLALPTAEVVSASQYLELVTAVNEYLSVNRLDEQVMGVLLGYRVPGYIDSIGGGMYESVPAQMQTGSTTIGPALNPLASPISYVRLTTADLAGKRMTARIDGPDLSFATEIINRSIAIQGSRLTADDSLFYFDPFVGDGAAYQSAFDDMIDWVTGEGGMRPRLNIVLSGDPGGNEDAGFDSVSGDGIYWGWSLTLPDADIFDPPAGRRAFCGQVYLDGASATTLRNVSPSNWADTPLAAGYAAVIASSRNSPVFWIPDVCTLFDAITLGWTLAEAWFVAQPVIRGGFYLVGDPLMTIGMPRAGIEVFGPLDTVKELDVGSPAYIVPEGVHELSLSNVPPSEGEQAVYIVRHTDEFGRTEASSTSIRIANMGGQSHLPPVMPAWPDDSGWAANAEDGQLRFHACWAGPLAVMRVGSVELMRQAEGGAETLASQPMFDPRDENILVVTPWPQERTRYRWRVTSPEGVVMYSEWSLYIEPAAQPTIPLQKIGVGS